MSLHPGFILALSWLWYYPISPGTPQTDCSLPSTHVSSFWQPRSNWALGNPSAPWRQSTSPGFFLVCEVTLPTVFQRRDFKLRLAQGPQNHDWYTLFPDCKEHHPSRPIPRSRAQRCYNVLSLRRNSLCLYKGLRHRNFKATLDFLTTSQDPMTVTCFSLYLEKNIQLNTERNDWARSNTCFSMRSLIPSCWEYTLSLKASASF